MKKTIAVGFIYFSLMACHSTKQAMQMNENIFDKEGHRGCRGLMPENTIPAMLKAIDLNVTTLEMDLQISKDKKVVVSHDASFNENITTTPQGTTLTKAEAAKLLLYSLSYDSIKKYDVGLKPHPLFPRQQKIPVHKPLLSDLIDETQKAAKEKRRPIFYNIEIKSTLAGDNIRHPPVEEFVDLAMDVINSKGISSRTIIQSFDPRALQVMHRKYPDIKTALLIEDDDKRSFEEQLKDLGFIPAIYSPHFSLVNEGLIKACKEKKISVIPWTVNDLETMKKLIALGVNGIISDYPDLFQKL